MAATNNTTTCYTQSLCPFCDKNDEEKATQQDYVLHLARHYKEKKTTLLRIADTITQLTKKIEKHRQVMMYTNHLIRRERDTPTPALAKHQVFMTLYKDSPALAEAISAQTYEVALEKLKRKFATWESMEDHMVNVLTNVCRPSRRPCDIDPVTDPDWSSTESNKSRKVNFLDIINKGRESLSPTEDR